MNLAVISLNTMFYKENNKCDTEGGQRQLEWLARELTYGEADTKFILAMHVYPGVNLFDDETEHFLHTEDQKRLLSILNDNADKIVFVTGAHIHHELVKIPTASQYSNLKVPMYVSPSVSPVYTNNPGVTTMTLTKSDDGKIKVSDLFVDWYQLQDNIFGFRDD